MHESATLKTGNSTSHKPERYDHRPLRRVGPAPERGNHKQHESRRDDEYRLTPGKEPERRALVAHVRQVHHVRYQACRLLLDHGSTHHGLRELVHGKGDERRGYEDPTRMGQV
jgi:hypothetical protein